MPRFLPFQGLRPDPAFAPPSDVVCPPYDVISDGQRAGLIARSQYNMVRVELPAGDYAGAARLFSQWKRDGFLVRESSPALYGYRMLYPAPTGEAYEEAYETVGVLGALVLEPPGQGILPHEETTPKDKTDRLQLIRAVHANTSPIWCLCTRPGLTALLAATRSGATPTVAVDDEGVTHELWALTDPALHEAVAEFAGAAPLLVADGHHRYETALQHRSETAGAHRDVASDVAAEARPGLGPGAVLCLVVELSERSLRVLAIHRTVSGLPAGARVIDAFKEGFELSRATTAGAALLGEMAAAGAAGVVTPEGCFLAKAREDAEEGASFELDSARADAALARLPDHQVNYEHDLERALAGVAEGRLDGAVLCRPATAGQIAATARGGKRMPPKTTFFWPKPRTGMVLRDW